MKTTSNLLFLLSCFGLVLVSSSGCTKTTQDEKSVVVVSQAKQKEAVRQLMEAMNFKQNFSQFAETMSQQMPQMVDQLLDARGKDVKLDEDQRAKIKKDATDAANNSLVKVFNDPDIVKGLEDIFTKIYMKHFTISEVESMTAFYKTAAGQKMVNLMPKIMQETMPQMVPLIMPKMNSLMQSIAQDAASNAAKP